MPSSTDLILLKIERAKKHIEGLNSSMLAFRLSQPYKISAKRDPRTRQPVYYIDKVDPVPADISICAGDAIQNMRTALDHLAYHLFVISPGNAGYEGKHIYFPIFENATKYKSESPRKVKGMKQEFIDAIDALRPYGIDPAAPQERGNETLWSLHRLNLIDKHRLLVTVWSVLRAHGITPTIRKQLESEFPDKLDVLATVGLISVTPPFIPLKQGDEFFRDIPDAEVNYDLQFTFDVAFGEPGIVQRQPLIEALNQMLKVVFEIIESFRMSIT
jgi:hypothetical protein